jgi:uncharacterized repeat protein (TIGR04138 family)
MVNWQTVRENAGPYPQAAFEFVRQGLEHTAQTVHGPEASDATKADQDAVEGKRHVTGQQLCLGLKDFAQKKYGRLARLVLSRWSIRRTDDFGRIVFAMIEAGVMRKTEDDTLEDFFGVFEFEELEAAEA